MYMGSILCRTMNDVYSRLLVEEMKAMIGSIRDEAFVNAEYVSLAFSYGDPLPNVIYTCTIVAHVWHGD